MVHCCIWPAVADLTLTAIFKRIISGVNIAPLSMALPGILVLLKFDWLIEYGVSNLILGGITMHRTTSNSYMILALVSLKLSQGHWIRNLLITWYKFGDLSSQFCDGLLRKTTVGLVCTVRHTCGMNLWRVIIHKKHARWSQVISMFAFGGDRAQSRSFMIYIWHAAVICWEMCAVCCRRMRKGVINKVHWTEHSADGWSVHGNNAPVF